MERGGRWTIENLEEIAEALGMRGWELLRMADGGDVPDVSPEEGDLLGAFRADGYVGVLAIVVGVLQSQRETRNRKR